MEQYILYSGKADIVLRHQVGSPCFLFMKKKCKLPRTCYGVFPPSHGERFPAHWHWWNATSLEKIMIEYIYESSNTWNDFKQFVDIEVT